MDAHLHRPAIRGAVPHLLPQGHARQADRAPDRGNSRLNVSILISTYGEDHWDALAKRRALPSCWNQGAYEVLQAHHRLGPIATARNELAAEAQGDWLCFLDGDDELAPGFLDAMRRALRRNGEFLLTPSVQRIEKGRKRPPFFYPEVPLDQANWLVVGTLISKRLFDEVGGFGDYPHGFEDWSVWAKAHKMGAQVVKVPNAIYIQYVNPQSKHRQGWRNRRWQVETHQRVARELEAWQP